MPLIDVKIKSKGPGLLMHSIDGAYATSPAKKELESLTSRSAKQKKEPAIIERRRQLEWELGLYTDPETELPCLPARLLQACVHTAAKQSRDGKRVHRGVWVEDVVFHYSPEGATVDELWEGGKHFYENAVRVQSSRVNRIRPLFKQWSCDAVIDIDTDHSDVNSLRGWLETAGRTVGVGDWRRDCGGPYGCFTVEYCEERKASS